MTINVVTYRKGGKPSDLLGAAKRLKTFVTKHGAEDLQLFSEVAGPDAGQWVLVIRFSGWEAFGRGMAAATADPDYATTIGALDAISEITGRRLAVGHDL